MDIERVGAQIEKDFEKKHLERLLDYIRQPSVSAMDWGLADMANLLAGEIREAGGEAEVVETSEFPVVYGTIDVGAERTLLFHGLYDVTPAEEPNWIVSPFDPEVRDFEDMGRCVIGRGAEDFTNDDAAGLDGDQIGKSAADIDAGTGPAHAIRSDNCVSSFTNFASLHIESGKI